MPGNYSVEVWAGDVQLCSNGARYVAWGVKDPVLLGTLEIAPSTGPSAGGTLVTVSVPAAYSRGKAMCRFGGLQAEATLLMNGSLVCISPPLFEKGPDGLSDGSGRVDLRIEALVAGQGWTLVGHGS